MAHPEPHPLSKFVRTSEPTEAEKASWAEFDAILKDDRVGDELRENAKQHKSVQYPLHFSGDPWAAGFGMLADDPLFALWKSAVNEYLCETTFPCVCKV